MRSNDPQLLFNFIGSLSNVWGGLIFQPTFYMKKYYYSRNNESKFIINITGLHYLYKKYNKIRCK